MEVNGRPGGPLTICEDLTVSDCRSAITLTPISPADAERLERIRRQFKPLLDQREAEGTPRESEPGYEADHSGHAHVPGLSMDYRL